MQPVVSIHISTYNTQQYISECLECVISQTLKDIEIIIIDDGSTDRTPMIIKEFAIKDSRIKVLFKEKNEGLAVSRNEAVQLAKGKYIGFVDGDDLLDDDLFRKTVEIAENNYSDLVIWDYVVFKNKREIYNAKVQPSDLSKIKPDDKLSLIRRPAFSPTKLIRTEAARNLKVHFPENLTRQDIPVHWKLFTHLDNVSIIPERLYYYRQQKNATTHQTDKRLFDLVAVTDIVKQQLVMDNLYEKYRDEFLRQQLGLLYGMVDNVDDALKPKAMEFIQDRIGAEHLQYLFDKKPLRKQTKDFYLSLNGSLPAKLRRFFWLYARKAYRVFAR